MVIVIARFRPRPERLDEFVALLEDVQAASREDDGCLHYGYYSEVADPASYVAVEEWRDMDALEDHLRQPHVARLIAALPEHAGAPVEVKAHVVERTGPLPLPR
jgi:quinol monooxygenase YgiN